MSHNDVPTDAPPTYQESVATGTSASSQQRHDASHLDVPNDRAQQRRSIEDEARPLPDGWVRQFDAKEHHQFFVDTKSTPPRSIWHHPYDDDDYLKTLSSEEREKAQQEDADWRSRNHSSSNEERPPLDSKTSAATAAINSDSKQTPQTTGSSHNPFPDLPPRPDMRDRNPSNASTTKKSFGERFKDKVTGMTHEERVQDRQRRAEEEQQYYEAHMRFRQAMARAMQTGQPQFLANDRDGKAVYVTPPAPAGYGGYGGYGGATYYNPYTQRGGPYYSQDPNVRYITPQSPYARPGYGRPGMGGMPLVAGAGAGLLGGMLLGGLLF